MPSSEDYLPICRGSMHADDAAKVARRLVKAKGYFVMYPTTISDIYDITLESRHVKLVEKFITLYDD